jgi:hypothetical protein
MMVECKTCQQNLLEGFCHACFRDFKAMSADPRYCHGCYDFLAEEMRMAKEGGRKKADWWPVMPETPPDRRQKAPIAEKAVTKLPQVVSDTSANGGEVLAQGGRPRKDIPMERIKDLVAQGAGITEIMRELKSQGISVSRRTIFRLLAGQRVMV